MRFRLAPIVPVLVGMTSLAALADDSEINGYRLDLLDQRGYFTPAFKTSVHHLVDARQALERARKTEAVSRRNLPALKKQCAALDAETAQLRRDLTRYARPEDLDFDSLQSALNNPAIGPADRLVLAQSFVWAYPTDPREIQVTADLRQIEAQMTLQKQSVQQAAAAQLAARALLLKRARAHELSLNEWQNFLRDASQQDLLRELGQPRVRGSDYWIYSGSWILDPVTKNPSGLRIDFNGTRVLSVVPASP